MPFAQVNDGVVVALFDSEADNLEYVPGFVEVGAIWRWFGWENQPRVGVFQPPPEVVPVRARADVLADLQAIDTRSIRALREGNATRVAGLEAQAQALRTELAAL